MPVSRKTMVPLIVACALYMENLDSTIVATALPAIAESIGENPLRLNLAITSYLLSIAVFIPISGWMADRFGTRTIFRSAIVLFTVGSICCGLVNTLPELVASRILQGIGGAMMVPVGRIVMLRTVAKSELMRAMSFLTVPALIGPVIAGPLGGFIVTYSSWRWIFFINIPIGILGVVLASKYIEEIKATDLGPLDLKGFLLIALGLAGLMFGFETAGRGVLPMPVVAVLLVVGVVCTTLYILHARSVTRPVVDLKLMSIPSFARATVGGSIFRAATGSLPFLLPLMLQLGFGLSPLASGMLTFSSAAGAMTMKFTANPIIRMFGFRTVLIFNAILSAAFMASYALFDAATPHLVIFAALLAGGFFRSLQFTSVNTLSYADVTPDMMSRASSFASMAQQLSVSFGIGLGALLLHITLAVHGRESLTAADFAPAFLTTAAMVLTSVPFFIRLSPDAGEEVSGHKSAPQPATEPSPRDKPA